MLHDLLYHTDVAYSTMLEFIMSICINLQFSDDFPKQIDLPEKFSKQTLCT